MKRSARTTESKSKGTLKAMLNLFEDLTKWGTSDIPTMESLIEDQKIWDSIAEERLEWVAAQRKMYLETRDKSIPELTDFYAGRSVLLTGGSGFLGKVLIEKFLRSVPDVKAIYVIVRTKKNQKPADRMAKILEIDLFDMVRRDRPEVLKKVVAIAGDMSAKGLGLSEESRALLQREVSVVIHAAASVRFDDPLGDAILLNTRGTRDIIELSKGMANLKAFVHVSTTYCNTNQPITMEEVYPTPYDWRHVIKIAEETPKVAMQALAPKIMGYQPNTYTFTKQLAEKIVDDAHHEIPCFIIRPSIVTSVIESPLPGWIDNFYGPSAFAVGYIKGVLRNLFADKTIKNNYVSVDAIAKSLLIAGWLTATNQRLSEDPSMMDVVNVTGEDLINSTHPQAFATVRQLIPKLQPKSLLAPRLNFTTNYYWYHYRMYLQVVFAVLADLLLRVSGQTPLLTKLSRRIYQANMCMRYFTCHTFRNSTVNFWKGYARVTEPDFIQPLHTDFVKSSNDQMVYIFRNILKEDKAGPHYHIIMEGLNVIIEVLEYCLYAWVGWALGSHLFHRAYLYIENLPGVV